MDDFGGSAIRNMVEFIMVEPHPPHEEEADAKNREPAQAVRAVWHRPSFRRLDASQAELGAAAHADGPFTGS